MHGTPDLDLEKLYVVAPQGEALNVQAHLVESKVIRLGHLLLVCGQGGLCLLLTEHKVKWDDPRMYVHLIYLNIEQVGFPELNRKDPDETPLEKKFHPLIISSSYLLQNLSSTRMIICQQEHEPAQYKPSNSGLTWEMLPPALHMFPEPHQYSCIIYCHHANLTRNAIEPRETNFTLLHKAWSSK